MLDKEFVRQKQSLLIKYLDELEPLAKCSLDEYRADYVKRHAVEKLIELVVEYASDINRHIIESTRQAPPQTYYGTFEEMGRLGIIPEDLAARLGSTTGLRNRLVHGYEKVSDDIVYYSLKPFLRNYKRYIALIDDYLASSCL